MLESSQVHDATSDFRAAEMHLQAFLRGSDHQSPYYYVRFSRKLSLMTDALSADRVIDGMDRMVSVWSGVQGLHLTRTWYLLSNTDPYKAKKHSDTNENRDR